MIIRLCLQINRIPELVKIMLLFLLSKLLMNLQDVVGLLLLLESLVHMLQQELDTRSILLGLGKKVKS